ncbi:hypothetical protein CYMTET_22253 [Cymbomonas tetramitiformis]|uniref:Cyclic nucleotide-binding domain-containing protein n=1 Tax=Cymbomonas tetramitiformis TaxID=36881 RepID=A0AAE0G0A1_9CHLO|nr:hypothetical protein CYMTET_22253 [Cymbomonas tetramitiformis]
MHTLNQALYEHYLFQEQECACGDSMHTPSQALYAHNLFQGRNEHELSTWFDDHSWDDDGEADLLERYIAALYWAFQTVTTVGYGDLSATTKAERLTAIFGMLIGGFMFSYVISNMFTVFNPESHERMQIEKMEMVNAYLRAHRLPKDLSRSIVQFFRQQNLELAGDRQVLFGIPRDLRIQVVNHIYSGVIQSVPLFKDAGTVFATEVCARLFPVYMPQASMVYEKDEMSSGLYLLVEGKVEVTTEIGCTEAELKKMEENNETKMRSLMSIRSTSSRNCEDSASESADSVKAESCVAYKKGSYFGEGCVFGWQRRTETVHIGNNTGQLLILKGDDFIRIAADYPQVLEKVAMVYIERLRRCGNLEAYDAAIARYKEICAHFNDKDSALSAIHRAGSQESLVNCDQANEESRPASQQHTPSDTLDRAISMRGKEQTGSQEETRNWFRSVTESNAHNVVSEVYTKGAARSESRRLMRLEREDGSDQPHVCRKCNQTMAEMTEMKRQLTEIREMILALGSQNANAIPTGTLNSQSKMKWAQWEDYVANDQQRLQRGRSGSSAPERLKKSRSQQEMMNMMDRL